MNFSLVVMNLRIRIIISINYFFIIIPPIFILLCCSFKKHSPIFSKYFFIFININLSIVPNKNFFYLNHFIILFCFSLGNYSYKILFICLSCRFYSLVFFFFSSIFIIFVGLYTILNLN